MANRSWTAVVLIVLLLQAPSGTAVPIKVAVATSPQLSKFWQMMKNTKVAEVLDSEEGAYTLFAPTNEAVRRFQLPGVTAILDKDPAALTKLVSYHVAVAKHVIEITDIPVAYAGMATSLYGTKMILEANGESAKVNHHAKTLQTIRTDNGVIHVIDQVITYPGWFPKDSLLNTLMNKRDFRAFYITAWDVRDEIGLTDGGPLTLFVPTNKAFAKAGIPLDGVALHSLLEEDRQTIIRILKYHMIHGVYLSKDELKVAGMARTLDVSDGKASYLAYQLDSAGLVDINNGEAKMERKKGSVQATNGIIHIVDKLLLPPGLKVPNINESAMAQKERVEAALIPDTPEPLPSFDGSSSDDADSAKATHLILAALCFVLLLLIYRLSFPPQEKYKVKKAKSQTPQTEPNYWLALALILLMITPLFSTTRWLVPPRLRASTDAVRRGLTRRFTTGDRSAVVVVDSKTAQDHEDALDSLLDRLKMRLYKKNLVDYGMDRVELIAMATTLDGERAGLKLAVWQQIYEEASRQATWVTDADKDATPEPASTKAPEVIMTDPIQAAKNLASEFEKDAIADGKDWDVKSHSPTTAQTTTSATRPPSLIAAPPVDDTKKYVLFMLAIPSTGSSTVECTFSGKHGNFAHRNQEQVDKVKYIPVKHLSEVAQIKSEFGRKDYKDVSPAATVVVAMVGTRPMTRVVRAFYKSLGKTNNADLSDFPCRGDKMPDLLKDKRFTIEAYAKLPPEARAWCEGSSNPMVKMLAGVDPWTPVTEDHYKVAAKAVEKQIDVLMIDDDEAFEKKSMLSLMTKLNMSTGSYIPCAPFDDKASIQPQLRVADTFSRDNLFDRKLYSEMYHHFNTKYAGTLEMTADASLTECNPKPTVCFDENDLNKELKVKSNFIDVNKIIKRSSSRQSVMCAGFCQLPKDQKPPSTKQNNERVRLHRDLIF